MQKLSILFFDWRMSSNKIEEALTTEFKLNIINFQKSLMEQLQRKDDLGEQMFALNEKGKMLTVEIIENFLTKELTLASENILLSGFPATLEHFSSLKKVLLNNEIQLERIWFFKQREPKLFMKNHFENPKEKMWLDKFGNEIIKKWKAEFKKRRKIIDEIKKNSDSIKWKIIEMDYISDISVEFILKKIRG